MSHVNYNYHHTATGRKGRRSASLTLLSALPILLFVFAGLTSIGNAPTVILTLQAALDLVKSALTILLSVVIIFVSIGCVSEMCGHRNETDGAFDSKHRCEPSALAAAAAPRSRPSSLAPCKLESSSRWRRAVSASYTDLPSPYAKLSLAEQVKAMQHAMASGSPGQSPRPPRPSQGKVAPLPPT